MKIVVSDIEKASLVKRVRDLEGRGWECLHPIKQATTSSYGRTPSYSKWADTVELHAANKFYVTMERDDNYEKKVRTTQN